MSLENNVQMNSMTNDCNGTDSNNNYCNTNNSSFIKVKENGNMQAYNECYSFDMFPGKNQMGMDFSSESLNPLNDMMNKNCFMDPAFIELAKQQCMNTIQQNLKALSFYEHCQAMYSQAAMQASQLPMAAMTGLAPDTPKSNNIFAPKPLPANKCDMSRTGRSHSMFMPNVSKANGILPDENNELRSNSENESEVTDKKQLSDPANSRKRMNVFRCPHTDRKHYAKNMCNNCYHKQGRNKKATKCPHKDRQNYAKGKCQNCYLNDYHKVKRKMKKQNKQPNKSQEENDRRISVETSNTDSAHEPNQAEASGAQN